MEGAEALRDELAVTQKKLGEAWEALAAMLILCNGAETIVAGVTRTQGIQDVELAKSAEEFLAFWREYKAGAILGAVVAQSQNAPTSEAKN